LARTFLVAGIVINGIATGLYIGAGLGPGPLDGFFIPRLAVPVGTGRPHGHRVPIVGAAPLAQPARSPAAIPAAGATTAATAAGAPLRGRRPGPAHQPYRPAIPTSHQDGDST